MAAILCFTRKRGIPQGGFGWGFMCFLYSPTESNYVEKHLLTFISIKGIPWDETFSMLSLLKI